MSVDKFFYIKSQYFNPVTQQMDTIPNEIVCLEKLYSDIYKFLGVLVPKTYIVKTGQQLSLASQRPFTYKNFYEIVGLKISYIKKQTNTAENELIEVCHYAKESVQSPYIDSEGINKIIKGKDVLLAAAALLLDIDVIGYYFDNILVIENPEYIELVKIDPGGCDLNLLDDVQYNQMIDTDLHNGYIIKIFKEYKSSGKVINLHIDEFFSSLTAQEKLTGLKHVCNINKQELYQVICNPKIPLEYLSMEKRDKIYNEIITRMKILQRFFPVNKNSNDIEIDRQKYLFQRKVIKNISEFTPTRFFARYGTSQPKLYIKKINDKEPHIEIKSKL